MRKVLLDISVVLDLLLDRLPWAADAAAIWEAHRVGQIDAALAAFSLPTIFYIVRKQKDLAVARSAIAGCLSTLTVLPVGAASLNAALALPGSDFEDNLQIACAVEAGMDAIVTRDPRGFAHAPVRVLTPAELVAQLSPSNGPSKPPG